MDDNIQELYGLLREADAKAQAGDEQAKADAQKIYDHILHLETQAKQQSASEYPPAVAGGVGEAALLTGKGVQIANQFKNIPKTIENVVANQKTQNEVLADLIKQNQMMQERGVAQPHGGSTWTEKMSGIAPQGSNMSKQSKDIADRMVGAIQPGGPAAGGAISPSGNVILPPDPKAERALATELRNARIAEELKNASLLGKLGHGARVIGELSSRALSKANPYLQAFSIPYEVADIHNKLDRGDKVGAGLSMLGAGAGAASLYPPLTVPAGLLSLGAHGADWAYQNYLERKNQPQQGYEQQPAQYATGGLVFIR